MSLLYNGLIRSFNIFKIIVRGFIIGLIKFIIGSFKFTKYSFRTLIVNFIYSRKGVYLIYLNLNICLSFAIFKLLLNWDQFLFNSKFQFTTAGLSHSLIQISITQELPNIWFGLDFFNLYLILLTTLLFSIAILSN
jgi:hypothetical protein